MNYYSNHDSRDHLEEFDSQLGDVESRGATYSSEPRFSASRRSQQQPHPYHRRQQQQGESNAYEGSIQRGMRNAQTERNETDNSGYLENILNDDDGGFSVNTGKMEELCGNDEATHFDGSTITSAHHDFNRRQQQTLGGPVLEFPSHTQSYHDKGKYPPSNTEKSHTNSFGSKDSKRPGETQKKSMCCGLGRLGIVLTLMAIVAVALAFCLWLFLMYLPGQDSDTSSAASAQYPPSSLCCIGTFDKSLMGEELCKDSGLCCIVCSDSVVTVNTEASDKDSGNDKDDKEAEDDETPIVQATEPPKVSPAPTFVPTPAPTPAPTDATPGPFVRTEAPKPATPEPTPAPTEPPTTVTPTIEPTRATAAPTDAPTDADTAEPTAKTTEKATEAEVVVDSEQVAGADNVTATVRAGP